MTKIWLGVAALLSAGSAQAATIDFEDFLGYTQVEAGNSLTSGGYNFGISADGSFEAVGYKFNRIIMNGTNTLLLANYGSITMTAGDGSAFSLSALDLAGSFVPSRWAKGVTVLGHLAAGGSISQFLNLEGTPSAFSTRTLSGFTGLSSVEFIPTINANGFANSNEFQIDNLVVNAAVAAVPEPATWALMIGGFGFIGAVHRRRNARAIAHAG